MCLMCEEEAFYQAYLAYMARKQAGGAGDTSAFKAEAVEVDSAEAPAAKKAVGDKAQTS